MGPQEEFTPSLFSSRDSQKPDGWMQCIENSACLHGVPYTISIYVSRCVSKKPLVTNSKQVTGHELCTVWADKSLVCRGVHWRRRGGGGVTWRQSPPPRGWG